MERRKKDTDSDSAAYLPIRPSASFSKPREATHIFKIVCALVCCLLILAFVLPSSSPSAADFHVTVADTCLELSGETGQNQLRDTWLHRHEEPYNVRWFFDRVFVLAPDSGKWKGAQWRVEQVGVHAERSTGTLQDVCVEMGRRGYGKILVLEEDVLLRTGFDKAFAVSSSQWPSTWNVVLMSSLSAGNTPGDAHVAVASEQLLQHTSFESGFGGVALSDIGCRLLAEEPGRSLSVSLQQMVGIGHPVFYASPSLVSSTRWQPSDAFPTELPLKVQQAAGVSQSLLVSVIMSTHNREKSIGMAIDSILAQTYTNFELIIVDDLSTDSTREVVRSRMELDDRITMIENTDNMGTYKNRNKVLQLASGDIITIQDDDDYALPNRLARQVQPIADGRALFTTVNVLRSTVPGEVIRELHPDADAILKTARESRSFVMAGVMTTMFHRRVFEEIGNFDDTRFAGDVEYIERFLAWYAGLLLSKDDAKIHKYLQYNPRIGDAYVGIDEVLHVSPQRVNSLTQRIPIGGDERTVYHKKYKRTLWNRFCPQVPSPFDE